MNKVSIIGTGSVGSTIAYTLTVMGLASEIVMIDINKEKALGEALDIRQGTPFCGACSVYAGDYRDAPAPILSYSPPVSQESPARHVLSLHRRMSISPR